MDEIGDLDQFPVGSRTLHSFTNRLQNTSKLLQRLMWFIFFTFMIRSLLKNFIGKGAKDFGSNGMGGFNPESGMLKSKAKKFTVESNIKVQIFRLNSLLFMWADSRIRAKC